jgi:ATP-dependent DNA ligase
MKSSTTASGSSAAASATGCGCFPGAATTTPSACHGSWIPWLGSPVVSVKLDGEGVACGPDGVTDFDLLCAALGRPRLREVFLYAFDLLELDGRDMRREPWSDRRWRLVRLLRGAGHGVQLSDHMEGNDGEAAFRHACYGSGGIVAKRRDKPYRSGRSPDWIKVKNSDARRAPLKAA